MNLSQTCWRDDQWLHANGGLSPANVLAYFASSPFYDSSCKNEIARQRGIPVQNLPNGLPGIEYILQDAQTPQLFVIRKQSKSLSGEETTLAIYYILHGMLYQAPVLYDVLSSRLDRASFTLQNILSEMRNDLDPMLRKNIPSASIESTSKKTGFKGEDVFDVSEDPELKAERRRRAEQAITSALLAHPLPRSASALGSEVEDCRPPMSSDEQREAPDLTQ